MQGQEYVAVQDVDAQQPGDIPLHRGEPVEGEGRGGGGLWRVRGGGGGGAVEGEGGGSAVTLRV